MIIVQMETLHYDFSLEDPAIEQEESTGGETTYRESYDDITVNGLLDHIPQVKI